MSPESTFKMMKGDDGSFPQLLCPQRDPSKLCIFYTVIEGLSYSCSCLFMHAPFIGLLMPVSCAYSLSFLALRLLDKMQDSQLYFNSISIVSLSFFFFTVKYVPNIAWDITYTKIFGVYLIFKYSWAPAFLFAKSDNPIWDCFVTNLLVFLSLPQGMLLIEPKDSQQLSYRDKFWRKNKLQKQHPIVIFESHCNYKGLLLWCQL